MSNLLARLLTWFSTHWVLYKQSAGEKKARKSLSGVRGELDEHAGQIARLKEQLEISESRCVILQSQIDEMQAALAFSRARWKAWTRDLGNSTEAPANVLGD